MDRKISDTHDHAGGACRCGAPHPLFGLGVAAGLLAALALIWGALA